MNMITNLFSSFDPCSSSFLLNNWMSITLVFLLFPLPLWLISNQITLFFQSSITFLYKELSLLLPNPVSKGRSLFFIRLILFIIFNNFFGLFPYIFTASSHLVVSLSLAGPLWLTFLLYGWVINTKHIFAHLVPLSTPTLLMPFIVLIESISNLIRPGTLTVRLSANMIAGHLLLTLLGNQTASSPNFTLLTLLLVTQIILLSLEAAVALIQAYVFIILSSLYSGETTL